MNWKIQAKQHFLNLRTPAQLKEIKVPEWVISVFFWPSLSMAEKRAVSTAYGAGDRRDENAAHIEQLLFRARDQHGDLLFAEREREDLLQRYSPEVIARISTEMMADTPKAEEAEKN